MVTCSHTTSEYQHSKYYLTSTTILQYIELYVHILVIRTQEDQFAFNEYE